MILQDYAAKKGLSFRALAHHDGIEALQELDCASNCGQDCVAVIDATAAFVALLDPCVSRAPVETACLQQLCVLYFG